jgi:uracil-DNA glycosylase
MTARRAGGITALLAEVRACTICAAHLPLGARPVLQVHPQARILIAGQAPGRRVHESGVPFDDASGDRLRSWLGVTRDEFYDAEEIAIMPMGFCYPGTGKSGDLPPRPECAPAWRDKLMRHLPDIELTIVLGQYAQKYHLEGDDAPVTAAVMAWKDQWPRVIPLPHPSPRNNAWLVRNPWFEKEVLPTLRQRVRALLTR